ncbi:Glutathione-dependent formaldehyde-activating enzyme/centromere protein V [Penicillium griseofulvum]|uniref:Glutathione-dependent formaldehyde-activating enzyme/centromere protein V n=1 Tax=Penicillium patulum TaxID=5078 RepID=A0A135LWH9_PENPA|nr:Glutathione-dependent formaldehyde-activating enzyme/centromere protein V [Penicillium griseofulvum]KXG53324.1 Glutathione-dependent formaldehyde-activating enzyme/centromere protein V [Penicillium griseofulvum]
MILTGSCMCGKIKYQADAEPAVKAVCHCLNCQKFSGSAFTTNFIIPRSSFKVLSGTPKSGKYMADSGFEYHTFFCGDCGSSLYGQPDSLPDMMSIKAGSLDNGAAKLEGGKIDVEAFIERRVAYLKPLQDASQVTGMIQA